MNVDDIIIPVYCILWALGGNIVIMGKEYCCISAHETLHMGYLEMAHRKYHSIKQNRL